jgi:NADH dehydrogenase [ubiquinone] 1 alpha subcomplex assembly factor 7
VSALARHLEALTRIEGPLSVARFMQEALGHPEHGAYASRNPIGAAGDFVTAPEISQMFGELVGVWAIALWRSMGAPGRVVLAEMGPGRGTLMKDLLRAARIEPAFDSAIQVHLIETSPTLAKVQREALGGAIVEIVPRFSDLPFGPLILIANELFDCLPIRQFQKTERGWCERLVDHDPHRGGFRFVLSPEPTPAATLIPPIVARAPVGALAEVSPASLSLAGAIGAHVAREGGGALIADYGHAKSAPGETLQALRRHARVDPLEDPGEADLTAHVDFESLGRAAREAGAAIHGPVGQGAFLRALGIEARAAALSKSANDAQRAEIAAALQRLTAPERMGSLFKMIAFLDPRLPAPPGFAP